MIRTWPVRWKGSKRGSTSARLFFKVGEMLAKLGKSLQIFGLVVLPLGIVMQLTDLLGRRIGLDQMLIMLVAGATAFCLGRLIEGYVA